jgi:phosphatidylserine/phosphatidylglycerophosphate/cardiolipin synthase-like enzyme
MEQLPELKVRMFLDIQRGPGDTSAVAEITRRFADRFRTKQWPRQGRLPEVFFDPRALQTDSQKKACLHAKCIVVDRKELFVSSANFTEAAQERNLEVGLLIRSLIVAERVQGHFEALLDANLLVRLF